MKDVFIAADNIISPLGFGASENFRHLVAGHTAVRLHHSPELLELPFQAALFDPNQYSSDQTYTKFEKLLIASIQSALKQTSIDPGDPKTILILSTTKGNISLIENQPVDSNLKDRLAIHHSAKLIADHLKIANHPIVVSNACISGILGIITGMRLIQSGIYDHAIVAGADIITKFILSGFQSFQALSPDLCKPFDKDRNGINLGEAAATIILSGENNHRSAFRVSGGATGNDANHISGPSRTGLELAQVIEKTIRQSGISKSLIGYVSAHGTATMYNDEMEAMALNHAGLQDVPLNSLKGYYGHTLGAAGLVEAVATLHQMSAGIVLPTLGFYELGVTQPVNVATNIITQPIHHALKIASGFGGCNGAVMFSETRN